MTVAFSYTIRGLRVSFKNESTEVPEGSTYLWDFGDLSPVESGCPIPKPHQYQDIGDYVVKLTIKSGDEEIGNKQSTVTLRTNSGLLYPINDMIDTYIPEVLLSKFSITKEFFIDKWQLFIQPLVNHEVPVQYYNDESYYEALENQLIMELSAYDFLVIELGKAIANLSTAQANGLEINEEGIVTGSADDNIKKIVTGPSEVEYHDKYDSASKIIKALSGSKGGDYGIMSTLKTNICMLASRLDIYLPMCGLPQNNRVVPSIMNNRRR